MSEGFDVFAALRTRFAPPEFVFLEEVRSATGFADQVRYADGLAVNCFRSRGQFLHGVEVKVSRSDWLAELKNPDKAEAIFKHCDFWWLAVPDANIVQNDLPATWGLLAPRGKALTAVVKAPKLSPQPLTVSFLASILRSVTEKYVLKGNIQNQIAASYQKGVEMGQHYAKTDVTRFEQERDHYKARLEALEKALGVQLYEGNAPNIAKAYQLLQHGVPEQYVAKLAKLGESALSIASCISDHVAAAKALSAKKESSA